MSRIARVLRGRRAPRACMRLGSGHRRPDRGRTDAARAARLRAPAHDERRDVRRRRPSGQRGHAPRRTSDRCSTMPGSCEPRSAPSAVAVARSRGWSRAASCSRPRKARRPSSGGSATTPPEIITSERIAPAGVPDGVVVFRHLPDGCCHNDVPVFLAAWQRGESVLTLHAGGRRANVRAFVDLIAAYDREA